MNKREEQKEKRREEILAASLDLFVRRGYAATKISDIAAACGMSVGLFFHYFESKEAVYKQLAEFGLSGPQSMMTLDRSEPLEFFQTVADLILGMLKEQPFIAKMFVLMSDAQRSEATPPELREIAMRVQNIRESIDIIIEGQRQGVIRQGDPQALSLAFWSAIQGIAEQIAIFPELPCPEAEWLVDILRA